MGIQLFSVFVMHAHSPYIQHTLAPTLALPPSSQVSGLMCSYNSINGVPSCANPWLLDEVARQDWGFDGCVCVCACERECVCGYGEG